jgi:pimeloyl-ACP methyl ester carboxylesterase
MSDISFHGVHAFYKTWGSGRAVALLHSGGSSSAQWDRPGECLADDCRLIAPDLLGFGATGMWPVAGELSQILQADLVAEVIARECVEPVDVVGHSYGGGTAVRLALRRPELVRSLVLIEPILSRLLLETGDPLYDTAASVGATFIESVKTGRPEDGWKAFIDSRNGEGTWSRMSDKAKERFLVQSQQTAEAFISTRENFTSIAECQSLKIPVTIVCGAKTYAPDRRVTEILKEAVRHARYVTIPEAGHMSPLTHPAEVGQIIREHLKQIQTVDA